MDTSTYSPDALTNLVSASYVEAFDTISFSGNLVDLYDRAIPYEKVTAQVVADGEVITKETFTDANGRYGFYFDNMPTCSSGTPVEKWSNFGTPRDLWKIIYNNSVFRVTSGSGYFYDRDYIQVCDEDIVCRVYSDEPGDNSCGI